MMLMITYDPAFKSNPEVISINPDGESCTLALDNHDENWKIAPAKKNEIDVPSLKEDAMATAEEGNFPEMIIDDILEPAEAKSEGVHIRVAVELLLSEIIASIGSCCPQDVSVPAREAEQVSMADKSNEATLTALDEERDGGEAPKMTLESLVESFTTEEDRKEFELVWNEKKVEIEKTAEAKARTTFREWQRDRVGLEEAITLSLREYADLYESAQAVRMQFEAEKETWSRKLLQHTMNNKRKFDLYEYNDSTPLGREGFVTSSRPLPVTAVANDDTMRSNLFSYTLEDDEDGDIAASVNHVSAVTVTPMKRVLRPFAIPLKPPLLTATGSSETTPSA